MSLTVPEVHGQMTTDFKVEVQSPYLGTKIIKKEVSQEGSKLVHT